MPSSRIFPFLKRLKLVILLAAALILQAGEAQAWGFGRAQSSAVLGMPLDFSVTLRLEASESPPECLAADVSAGDIPVPRSAVFVSLEGTSGSTVVRVRTSVAIDEPLVTIRLSAGCSSSIARRFTLFADPPGHLAAPVLAQAEALQAAVPAPAAAAGATPAAVPAAQVLSSPAPAASPGQGDPVRKASTAAPASSLASAAPAAAASLPGRGAANTRARLPDGAASLADASAQAAQRGAARAPRAKLQLDAPTLLMSTAGTTQGSAVATALQAAQDAASAARASASAAQARAEEMQKSIDALRQEAQANREAVARLTRALEDAQGSAPVWLWAALVALGGLSAVLLVRMRHLQVGGSVTPWWSASAAQVPESPGQSLEKTSSVQTSEALAPSRLVAPTPPPSAPSSRIAPAVETFQSDAADETLPVQAQEKRATWPDLGTAPDWAALPGVSVEELLDLQHQAEFFSVLGQEDAAVKLLADHLRQTRGDYPLPYLQLMDIFRRHSDETGFGQVRSRFQQRFGISLRDWQDPVQVQRELQDCPDMLLEIERVWQDPARAMEALEGMLRDGGRSDGMETPVHSDLLFLYTLARDLRDAPVPASGQTPATATVAAVAGAVDVDLDFGLVQGSSSSARPDLSLEFDLPPAVPRAGPPSRPHGLSGVEAALPELGLPRLSSVALTGEPSPPLLAIDIPLADAEEGSAAATSVPGGASKGAAVDLKLDELWDPSPAVPSRSQLSRGEALPLQFPDLDVPVVEKSVIPQAAAVDLELSFDTPDLESLPSPLSANEQRAASRFSLFSEELDQVKRG